MQPLIMVSSERPFFTFLFIQLLDGAWLEMVAWQRIPNIININEPSSSVINNFQVHLIQPTLLESSASTRSAF